MSLPRGGPLPSRRCEIAATTARCSQRRPLQNARENPSATCYARWPQSLTAPARLGVGVKLETS
jgi:hypothetical protein